MADAGHVKTEKEIAKLEKRIREVYSQAEQDILDKMDDFNRRYKAKESIHLQELKDGKITQEQFDNWKKGQVFQGEQWKAKRQQIADTLYNANKVAINIVNGQRANVFSINANYQSYQMEHDTGVNFGFDIYDSATVARLLKDDPQILPERRVNANKDKAWNRRNINNCIVQGIIQGESLDKIAKRISETTGNRNRNTMLTAARTSMTAAQNAGRVHSLQHAKDLGINVVKEWMATLDAHTRDSHARIDGEKVPVGDKWHPTKFSNGCRYPGDPEAPAHEVYNCRCTMVGDVTDYPAEYQRYDNIDGVPIENMTYKEWEKAKKKIIEEEENNNSKHKIVNGVELPVNIERYADGINGISNVLADQGFDGVPKIVSQEEFDSAVAAANGGNGFIAQRTYTAIDEDILDEYRRQLYEGDFYVDCSVGGAQYGQGMYCAADYSGKLSEGIKSEMEHYQAIGRNRFGQSSLSYTETLTLDPSARIIKYEDLQDEYKAWEQTAASDAVRNKILELKDISEESREVLRFSLNISDMSFDEVNKMRVAVTDEEEKDRARKYLSELNQLYREVDMKARNINVGTYAAMQGYDAINAEGHGGSGSYTVVLNRTKLIILDGRRQ